MTNFQILGAVKQTASERLFHIIIEAHRTGESPYKNQDFAECLSVVQAVEIATTVAHKFDTTPPSAKGIDDTGQRLSESEAAEGHLEGTSFQVNKNTLKEGDEMDRAAES